MVHIYIQDHRFKPILDEERFRALQHDPTHLGTTLHHHESKSYDQMLAIKLTDYHSSPYDRRVAGLMHVNLFLCWKF